MTGIRQVAQRAGVSTATVARVVKGTATVSPKTRVRVESAIAELEYVPNAVARALSKGRLRMLGMFVPDIVNPFFSEVAQGLEDRAASAGFHCMVASSHFKPEREQHFLNALSDGTVAALAVTVSGGDPRTLDLIRRARVPMVFIDRRPAGFDAPLVSTNNEESAADAVRLLLDAGHRDIAMIAGPTEFETMRARVEGYRVALRGRGLEPQPSRLISDCLEVAGGRYGMNRILDLNPTPTAVLCANNLLTVGALEALRERGVKLPTDMSLISFDDMSLFPFVDPPITAVAQPAMEMGITAADMLLAVLDGGHPRDISIPSHLIERGSVTRPRT